MAETSIKQMKDLLAHCPIDIPTLNKHFQANGGKQLQIEARQQNQVLPHINISQQSVKLFSLLQPVDKGISDNKVEYGDALVVIKIQILNDLSQKFLNISIEQINEDKFNETVSKLDEQYEGLVARIGYKIDFEIFIKSFRQKNDKNIYLVYYNIEQAKRQKQNQNQSENKEQTKIQTNKLKQNQQDNQIKVQKSQQQNKEEQNKEEQNNKEQNKEEQNNKEQNNKEQNNKEQNNKEQNNKEQNGQQNNNTPQKTIQKQQTIKTENQKAQQNLKNNDNIDTQQKQGSQKQQKNQYQQSYKNIKNQKVLDDAPSQQKQQNISRQQFNKLIGSKQQEIGSQNRLQDKQNSFMSILKQYVSGIPNSNISPQKQSKFNTKISLAYNSQNSQQNMIKIKSHLLYCKNNEKFQQLLRMQVNSKLQLPKYQNYIMLRIQSKEQDIEFLKTDIDIIVNQTSETSNNQPLNIQTIIIQQYLYIIFPQNFILRIQSLTKQLQDFVQIFSEFTPSNFIDAAFAVEFMNSSKLIFSLLNGFKFDGSIRAHQAIMQVIQRNIQKKHKPSLSNNMPLLLFIFGNSQQINLNFRHLKDIKKFLKRMGLQDHTRILQSIITEEFFDDLFLEKKLRKDEDKLMDKILNFCKQKSQSQQLIISFKNELSIITSISNVFHPIS